MAITKKSLISKAPAKNSSAKKNNTVAAGPVTPGKMVPAMRLAKSSLTTAKASLQTGMTRF
jgi:hypothetical protein